MLIAITLISGLSLAEDANVSNNESENATAAVVEPTAAPSDAESAAPVEAATSEEMVAQTLQGSWILTMDDARVSMVLYQSGEILFGAANSESPKPWNAVISGSVSGDVVNLRILSLQDGFLVSTLVAGTAQDGSIAGNFVQSDSQGMVNSGTVMGTLTSPDTSGYEPADVPATATTTATNTIAAATTIAPVTAENATTEETSGEGNKFLDVTTVSDQITSTWTGFEI